MVQTIYKILNKEYKIEKIKNKNDNKSLLKKLLTKLNKF